MKYLLDTNILLAYLRYQEKTRNYIDAHFNPLGKENLPILSAVSLGELNSIALQNEWGIPRKDKMLALVNQLIVIDIYADDIIDRYAEIDAFSQGRLKNRQLNSSSRNMSKNDLWIAATASVLEAELLTTDLDFQHLNNVFLVVNTIAIL